MKGKQSTLLIGPRPTAATSAAVPQPSRRSRRSARYPHVQVLGPISGFMERKAGKFRMQLLVQGQTGRHWPSCWIGR
jgi:primosomal protein N'